ncbi:glycosyl hydrolase family 65 protein [Streptomyces sp. NPDC058268]|uniref:glycosyl hydrolase family 65 protein n=1 Tax=Streptomyces sp. NPDC058268 TaxID=3346413 RepID=UPI0036EA9B41
MRHHSGVLSFAPPLPEALSRLAFTVLIRGQRLRVEITATVSPHELRRSASCEFSTALRGVVVDGALHDVPLDAEWVVRPSRAGASVPNLGPHPAVQRCRVPPCSRSDRCFLAAHRWARPRQRSSVGGAAPVPGCDFHRDVAREHHVTGPQHLRCTRALGNPMRPAGYAACPAPHQAIEALAADMYVLLLPALLPFALLGTMMTLSWWEDLLLPPQEPTEPVAGPVSVTVALLAPAETPAGDHSTPAEAAAEYRPVRRSAARLPRLRTSPPYGLRRTGHQTHAVLECAPAPGLGAARRAAAFHGGQQSRKQEEA